MCATLSPGPPNEENLSSRYMSTSIAMTNKRWITWSIIWGLVDDNSDRDSDQNRITRHEVDGCSVEEFERSSPLTKEKPHLSILMAQPSIDNGLKTDFWVKYYTLDIWLQNWICFGKRTVCPGFPPRSQTSTTQPTGCWCMARSWMQTTRWLFETESHLNDTYFTLDISSLLRCSFRQALRLITCFLILFRASKTRFIAKGENISLNWQWITNSKSNQEIFESRRPGHSEMAPGILSKNFQTPSNHWIQRDTWNRIWVPNRSKASVESVRCYSPF